MTHISLLNVLWLKLVHCWFEENSLFVQFFYNSQVYNETGCGRSMWPLEKSRAESWRHGAGMVQAWCRHDASVAEPRGKDLRGNPTSGGYWAMVLRFRAVFLFGRGVNFLDRRVLKPQRRHRLRWRRSHRREVNGTTVLWPVVLGDGFENSGGTRRRFSGFRGYLAVVCEYIAQCGKTRKKAADKGSWDSGAKPA